MAREKMEKVKKVLDLSRMKTGYDMTIDISVVICTHNPNRECMLESCLNSVMNQSLQIQDYEIIVVDNSSSGDTDDLKEVYSKRQNFKVIYESVLGLSRARNAGLQAASGPIVAFLDDDAEAYPDWLEQILAAFKKSRASAVGGLIEPIWGAPRPGWLPHRAEVLLGILDLGKKPRILNEKEYLVGTNMAFDRLTFLSLGGFESQLGRIGSGSLMGDEETLAQIQLRNDGKKVYYDPAIRVRHHVQPVRLKFQWVVKRYFWQGVSKCWLEALQPEGKPMLRLRLVGVEALRLVFRVTQLCGNAFSGHRWAYVDQCCYISEFLGVIAALSGMLGSLPRTQTGGS